MKALRPERSFIPSVKSLPSRTSWDAGVASMERDLDSCRNPGYPLIVERHSFKLLYLFAGPPRPGDMQSVADAYGHELVCVDIQRDAKKHDLLDDFVVESLLRRVCAKEFHAVLMAPPVAHYRRREASWEALLGHCVILMALARWASRASRQRNVNR